MIFNIYPPNGATMPPTPTTFHGGRSAIGLHRYHVITSDGTHVRGVASLAAISTMVAQGVRRVAVRPYGSVMPL